MILLKIFLLSFSLVSFGIFGWWTSVANDAKPIVTEIKTRMPDVSPEVRDKALGLLDHVMVEAESVKSKEDGVRIRFLLTDLLWEKDEPRARALFSSLAVAADKEGCYCNVIELRTIAARDSKLALRIAESSKSGLSEYERDAVYDYFVKQYPDEALRQGKQAVEGNRYLTYLDFQENYGSNAAKPANVSSDRLSKLYAANKSYGANLASDILRKLGEAPLQVPTPYPNYNTASNTMRAYRYNGNLSFNAAVPANLAAANWNGMPVTNIPYGNVVANRPIYVNSPLNLASSPGTGGKRVPFAAAASLLTLAADSIDTSVKTGETPLLTDVEIRVLARVIVLSLSKAKRFEGYTVRPVYVHLKKYAPTEWGRFERTLSVRQRREIVMKDSDGFWPELPFSLEPVPPSPNETFQEKKEREMVNDLRNFGRQGWQQDAEEFVRLSNPEKYPDLMERFEDFLPAAYAKVGNMAKLRPLLANESNRSTRLTLISFAAIALWKEKDKLGAIKLIEEGRSLLPAVVRKKEEFSAAETFALALAYTDPEKGFALAERLLDHANRLLGLSEELRGFTTGEDDASSSFYVRRSQIAMNSSNAIKVIRVLAHSDFERTVKLADRFSDPEQRVFFRWYITNALLNKNADTEEGQFSTDDPEMRYYRPTQPIKLPVNSFPSNK